MKTQANLVAESTCKESDILMEQKLSTVVDIAVNLPIKTKVTPLIIIKKKHSPTSKSNKILN